MHWQRHLGTLGNTPAALDADSLRPFSCNAHRTACWDERSHPACDLRPRLWSLPAAPVSKAPAVCRGAPAAWVRRARIRPDLGAQELRCMVGNQNPTQTWTHGATPPRRAGAPGARGARDRGADRGWAGLPQRGAPPHHPHGPQAGQRPVRRRGPGQADGASGLGCGRARACHGMRRRARAGSAACAT